MKKHEVKNKLSVTGIPPQAVWTINPCFLLTLAISSACHTPDFTSMVLFLFVTLFTQIAVITVVDKCWHGCNHIIMVVIQIQMKDFLLHRSLKCQSIDQIGIIHKLIW